MNRSKNRLVASWTGLTNGGLKDSRKNQTFRKIVVDTRNNGERLIAEKEGFFGYNQSMVDEA